MKDIIVFYGIGAPFLQTYSYLSIDSNDVEFPAIDLATELLQWAPLEPHHAQLRQWAPGKSEMGSLIFTRISIDTSED